MKWARLQRSAYLCHFNLKYKKMLLRPKDQHQHLLAVICEINMSVFLFHPEAATLIYSVNSLWKQFVETVPFLQKSLHTHCDLDAAAPS